LIGRSPGGANIIDAQPTEQANRLERSLLVTLGSLSNHNGNAKENVA